MAKQYHDDAICLCLKMCAIYIVDFTFTEDDVIDFEHLYASMMKCKLGVLWKDSVASFYLNAIERILKLEDELASEQWVKFEKKRGNKE